jgi:hypothetical protein
MLPKDKFMENMLFNQVFHDHEYWTVKKPVREN